MFKKFIAQQIADKVADIPDEASIKDATAFAEEVMQSIELAQEQHLAKYSQEPEQCDESALAVA